VFRGLKRGKCFIVRSTGLTRFGFKGCFEAGTQVAVGYTPEGQYLTRSIEDLREGDYVLARDQHDAGDGIELRRIAAVLVKTSDHVRVLRIQDADGNVETIRTTDEHPFYVTGLGWVRAGELVAGQRLNEADNSNDAVILSSEREEHPSGVTVYNLTVEGDHTYFVDDGQGATTSVWVHNACTRQLRRALNQAVGGGVAHHIVAALARGAEQARKVLQRANISPESFWNGVMLTAEQHRSIHTKNYYKNVTTALKDAEVIAKREIAALGLKGRAAQDHLANRVIKALDEIKARLLRGDSALWR
jgi:hypothetical protein